MKEKKIKWHIQSTVEWLKFFMWYIYILNLNQKDNLDIGQKP